MSDGYKPRVVVLTGAGISAESGLKTFRDSNGLWENHRVEDVATPEGFAADPDRVYRFYNERRAQLQTPGVEPNAAHRALAELEQALGEHFLLVTQNVDDLHERAGSNKVLHMHGELLSARCCQSGQAIRWLESFDETTECRCCIPGAKVRPDIVWFGEVPMHMDDIIIALAQADVFIAIGTSGQVYPAANFVAMAADGGARTIEINLEPSQQNSLFDENIVGEAGKVLPDFVSHFIRDYC
ncbi:NAD-dependent protein deacylase [Alteromonas sp. chi3]|uniref:NAD-dependent protein deacylase n=2 Tax=Alteromonas gilva TaxID=2987522 RepID=A0ABT5L3V3_9ALTE|nr:Sir2 family NAD+-dependent deacetylase [Alteromonas gilva]MDC8831114.1 NAD-dependent protein deacylase [Alteromonas gilva]